MTDVRALLKAKRQEARVIHPFATYSSAGQLRCTACATAVKHASAWQGHLGSKSHRTNVTRLREEELRKTTDKEGEKEGGKRKAEDQDTAFGDGEPKRQKISDSVASNDADLDLDTPRQTVFPRDFFSNAPRISVSSLVGDLEDGEDASVEPSEKIQSTLDLEWERFQRDVVNASDDRESYDRATLVVEPEIVSHQNEGFPSQQTDDTQANTIDEENARRQKEHDERELIMDRLLDEERAQEDADMKVSVLKGRLDALKHKRRIARARAKPEVS
jgi:zinc finger protein 830